MRFVMRLLGGQQNMTGACFSLTRAPLMPQTCSDSGQRLEALDGMFYCEELGWNHYFQLLRSITLPAIATWLRM